jgi:beta-glucosidase
VTDDAQPLPARPTDLPDDPGAFEAAVARVRAGADPVAEARVLYAALDDSERLGLLDGDIPFWRGMRSMLTEGYNVRPYPMGAVPRLGIPGLLFVDGPRGCVSGHGTAFPVSMARGATWDVALEERVGRAIGAEIHAQGGNFFGGVCINLPRHPAWGRAQETYGEDPVLLGEMGAALVRGTAPHAMPCVKHYALNSMENARFTVDVQVDEATLHELFLPHFRRAIEAGAAAVMSAYNSVNGEWAGQNPYLLTQVLREDWGFEGTVITDFMWGMRDGTAALRAGLDVEAPFAQQRATHLAADIAAGRASWADVERAGLRTLATQLRHHAARADAPDASVLACPEHRALAREVAARAMVLLRNEPVAGEPVLPLDVGRLTRVAVLGRLADLPNTGDHGSSDVHPPEVVTALAGLRAALPDAVVEHVADADPAAAAARAAAADVAVVVVGYTAEDEGEFVDGDVLTRPELAGLYPEPVDDEERAIRDELFDATSAGLSLAAGETVGGDRADLHLPAEDVALVRAVAAAQPRTVVAVVTAGAVLMEEWRHEVPGLVMMWYAGMEGGHALADVLLGRVDPGGRLPFVVPTSADHLPPFDRDATAAVYDRWFGARYLERLGVEPAYPLGFGLSYTTIATELVEARRDGEEVRVVARLTNTGDRDGRHVAQVYGIAPSGERHLLGFAAAAVPAGAAVDVVVTGSLRPLGTWDAGRRRVVVPDGEVVVELAAHRGDPAAAVVTLPAEGA